MIAICDTGPLLAYLDRRDRFHEWAIAVMKEADLPVLTCEPVLTEVIYFLREDRVSVNSLLAMLERNALRSAFVLANHWARVRTLMARYDQMDLADASVVVMSELHSRAQVLTLDRKDFSIYRRNDRQVIDFIAPPLR